MTVGDLAQAQSKPWYGLVLMLRLGEPGEVVIYRRKGQFSRAIKVRQRVNNYAPVFLII